MISLFFPYRCLDPYTGPNYAHLLSGSVSLVYIFSLSFLQCSLFTLFLLLLKNQHQNFYNGLSYDFNDFRCHISILLFVWVLFFLILIIPAPVLFTSSRRGRFAAVYEFLCYFLMLPVLLLPSHLLSTTPILLLPLLP